MSHLVHKVQLVDLKGVQEIIGGKNVTENMIVNLLSSLHSIVALLMENQEALFGGEKLNSIDFAVLRAKFKAEWDAKANI